ncbi:MAG: DNA ligase [Desulfobacterales bacterium]|nr:DNA ligase [Desulfobacterales bacterium]
MLPKKYQGQDIAEQWLWSEKLDGIRGEWTGTKLLTKQGYSIDVPDYFIKNFPPFPLSGEIWGGRQTFERTSGIVATSGRDKGWHTLRFAIFDSKHASLPFENRIDRAKKWFEEHPSEYAFVIKQQPVKDKAHLNKLLKDIKKGGGEGLVLIKKGSMYKNGRSVDVLKVKDFDDAEAVVVGYVPGKGRHKGRMGSMVVELYSDRTIKFKIGTGFSDEIRKNPPPVGALITFKYTGFYKSGKPKFPSFLRVRSLDGNLR